MMTTFFSAAWHGEAFCRQGFRMLQSLVLVDPLFLLDGGRRREEKVGREITVGEEGFSELDLPY
jgi:hypothetical protein